MKRIRTEATMHVKTHDTKEKGREKNKRTFEKNRHTLPIEDDMSLSPELMKIKYVETYPGSKKKLIPVRR